MNRRSFLQQMITHWTKPFIRLTISGHRDSGQINRTDLPVNELDERHGSRLECDCGRVLKIKVTRGNFDMKYFSKEF